MGGFNVDLGQPRVGCTCKRKLRKNSHPKLFLMETPGKPPREWTTAKKMAYEHSTETSLNDTAKMRHAKSLQLVMVTLFTTDKSTSEKALNKQLHDAGVARPEVPQELRSLERELSQKMVVGNKTLAGSTTRFFLKRDDFDKLLLKNLEKGTNNRAADTFAPMTEHGTFVEEDCRTKNLTAIRAGLHCGEHNEMVGGHIRHSQTRISEDKLLGMTGMVLGVLVGFDECFTGDYLQRAACLTGIMNLAVQEHMPEAGKDVNFAIRRGAIPSSHGQELKAYVLCILGGDKLSEAFLKEFDWAILAPYITTRPPIKTECKLIQISAANDYYKGKAGQADEMKERSVMIFGVTNKLSPDRSGDVATAKSVAHAAAVKMLVKGHANIGRAKPNMDDAATVAAINAEATAMIQEVLLKVSRRTGNSYMMIRFSQLHLADMFVRHHEERGFYKEFTRIQGAANIRVKNDQLQIPAKADEHRSRNWGGSAPNYAAYADTFNGVGQYPSTPPSSGGKGGGIRGGKGGGKGVFSAFTAPRDQPAETITLEHVSKMIADQIEKTAKKEKKETLHQINLAVGRETAYVLAHTEEVLEKKVAEAEAKTKDHFTVAISGIQNSLTAMALVLQQVGSKMELDPPTPRAITAATAGAMGGAGSHLHGGQASDLQSTPEPTAQSPPPISTQASPVGIPPAMMGPHGTKSDYTGQDLTGAQAKDRGRSVSFAGSSQGEAKQQTTPEGRTSLS